MKDLLLAALFSSTMLIAPASMAAEKTIKLAVAGITCASCPHIVRYSINEVEGTKSVEITDINSEAIGTFEVIFDDEVATVDNFLQATVNYGFRSALIPW
jgi:mercuric ion binding protein